MLFDNVELPFFVVSTTVTGEVVVVMSSLDEVVDTGVDVTTSVVITSTVVGCTSPRNVQSTWLVTIKLP